MKKRYKSKTNITAMMLAIVGAIELNIHFLKEMLGDWYGLTYVVIAVLMVILREVTDEPVG